MLSAHASSRVPPAPTHIYSANLPSSINGNSILPVLLSPRNTGVILDCSPFIRLHVKSIGKFFWIFPECNAPGLSHPVLPGWLWWPPSVPPEVYVPKEARAVRSWTRSRPSSSALKRSSGFPPHPGCEPRPWRWPSRLRVWPPARCQPHLGPLFLAPVTPSPHSVPAGTLALPGSGPAFLPWHHPLISFTESFNSGLSSSSGDFHSPSPPLNTSPPRSSPPEHLSLNTRHISLILSVTLFPSLPAPPSGQSGRGLACVFLAVSPVPVIPELNI